MPSVSENASRCFIGAALVWALTVTGCDSGSPAGGASGDAAASANAAAGAGKPTGFGESVEPVESAAAATGVVLAADAARQPGESSPQAALPVPRKRMQGDDWCAFLGPTHDSKSAERGVVTDWGTQGPPVIWHKRMPTSYAMPAVAQGRLFHFGRRGDRARVDCLTAETGRPLWSFEYPTDYEDMYGYDNGPRCMPVVDDDRVFLFGPEGMLHCLSATDGSLVWRVDTAERFGVIQNFFGVGSTPLVEGELLLVAVGGSPPGSDRVPFEHLEGNGSGIVAFDKRTGEIRYQVSDELAGYASPCPATIAGRRWCFLFARGGLLGFEPQSGRVDFHYPWRAPILESVNASNPVVIGDEVLISETYGPGASLLRVRPGGCDVVWSDLDRRRDKALQTHWNTPIYHEGFVYGSSGRHENNAELRCVEWATGRVAWSEPELGRASLLYVDGHLVCLCERGELLLLRATPEKFDPVARTLLRAKGEGLGIPGLSDPLLLGYPAWAAPILSHGLLYVRGGDRLACLELIPE